MSFLLDTESSTKEQYQYEKKNSNATMHVNGHTTQDAKQETSKFFYCIRIHKQIRCTFFGS